MSYVFVFFFLFFLIVFLFFAIANVLITKSVLVGSGNGKGLSCWGAISTISLMVRFKNIISRNL